MKSNHLLSRRARATCRFVVIALAASLPFAATGAARTTSEETDQAELDTMIANLVVNPPYLTARRIPPGYSLGRCLLKVDGREMISGPCAYDVWKDGAFQFHGSRQIYEGVDFPGSAAPMGISTDYFVYVLRFDDVDGVVGPSWHASWNEDRRSTHADASLGPVVQEGDCYTNPRTTICLWK